MAVADTSAEIADTSAAADTSAEVAGQLLSADVQSVVGCCFRLHNSTSCIRSNIPNSTKAGYNRHHSLESECMNVNSLKRVYRNATSTYHLDNTF